MLSLLGGIFLGWSLGANDAANVFGTAVSSRMVRFATAAVLASIFVVAGAWLEGQRGIATLQSLTQVDMTHAVVVSVAAALTVTLMTLAGLPVSTSQAVVGAFIGLGIVNHHLFFKGLGKVVACWVGTPIGGLLIALILYKVLAAILNRMPLNIFQVDGLLRAALIIMGCYGAYALGANNVANVTAVYVAAGQLSVEQALLIGSVSIALGIVTFSRPVMMTVGRKLVRLDPFSALVVVSSEAITVHLYTLLGVPVSTSQAVVGAVLGIGILKGAQTIRVRTLGGILFAWVVTPAVACLWTLALDFLVHLQYVPHGA
ncbi:inorganic phosphate transporter, PiT family [Desulfacinum hydrothermale DSM 13146]|uniref:Inorganic phosphate transporter, PiT family n=1 Tax=Desulfacinum hydrothermale DSM 13146 TaxID=1121390 RepID=A0A1W1XTI7_9BACT|nr:inorganic phosphate transporter [Desulfacinum hydrothermale]SMC27207.1 inorganic phosphate transporter, PiT family [Desulfacinum hydrothermale DSM 13146]